MNFFRRSRSAWLSSRELCQGRFPVFGFPDDGHAEAMKGPNVDILAQAPAEAFVDPAPPSPFVRPSRRPAGAARKDAGRGV